MNYEALGRYTSARDLVERSLARRNTALLSLAAQAKSASAAQIGRTLAQPLNANALRDLLDEAEEQHNHALAALAELNAVAMDADRPQLKIG